MDIQPVIPGHLVVVPRRHAVSAGELDDASAAAVWNLALRCSAALRRSGLRCEGVNFFVADGEAAGQSVFHFLLHVFPRFRGDGFGLTLPVDHVKRERAELNAHAAKIRAAL
jgi:histidine triad (HIT) family protein